MLLACVLLPCVFWLILRFTMAPGPYEMDISNGTARGTFFPQLIVYSIFFYALAGMGAYGACSAWHYGVDWGACLLLFAMAYSLLFNIWLAFNFEMYMQRRYMVPGGKSPYTLNRYAATMALAVSAILLFLAGVVLTATAMAMGAK